MPLNREIVVHRALRLVNKIGFDKLTTRRLGEELGVESTALYRHFKSKTELVDHMAAAILLPVLTAPEKDEKWDDWLLKLGRESFQAVMKYRDGPRIVAQALPVEPYDLISRPLVEAGFKNDDAVYASKMFTSFMAGWQIREDSLLHRKGHNEPKYDHMKAFEFALNRVIDGLRVHLQENRKKERTKKKSGIDR